MFEDKVREEGFEIFKKGLVRRLSPTHFVAKVSEASGWQIVELLNGRWTCDCGSSPDSCVHLYATQLKRSTSRLQPEQVDEDHLKCRYCGSPDIARCGFRYNARGIARRYRCNDCERKFSIPHFQSSMQTRPSELVWLLNEMGMLTSKLAELLSELNDRIELVERRAAEASSVESTPERK
jgi:DNA-directed RNA polymerase subunit RPC12/RpoP